MLVPTFSSREVRINFCSLYLSKGNPPPKKRNGGERELLEDLVKRRCHALHGT